MNTIIGVFEDRVEADLAIQDFQDHGYEAQDISIITRRPPVLEADKLVGDKGGRVRATSGGIAGGFAKVLISLSAIVITLGILFLIIAPTEGLFGFDKRAAIVIIAILVSIFAIGFLGLLVSPRSLNGSNRSRVGSGVVFLAVPVRTEHAYNEVVGIFKSHQALNVKRIRKFT